MKKSIFTLALAMLLAGAVFSGVNAQDNKKNIQTNKKSIQDNKKNIRENKKDIGQLEKDGDSDFQNFKNRSYDVIKDNEKLFPKYRQELKDENSIPQARDRKQLDFLENKNHEMKTKLDNYKNDGTSDWREFRTGFNQEIHDLQQAFKAYSVRVTQ